MFKKMKTNKKGFTLAELLIVVAIIGVLVAISIPIFTSQIEKAREATDAANLRAAYAEASAEVLKEGDDVEVKIEVELCQMMAGWTDTTLQIAGHPVTEAPINEYCKGKTAVVTVDSNGEVKFDLKEGQVDTQGAFKRD